MIENLYKKVSKMDTLFSTDQSLEGEILGIHEAATKLWQSLHQTEWEKRRRLASVFIGTLVMAKKMKVDNISSLIGTRLEELGGLKK